MGYSYQDFLKPQAPTPNPDDEGLEDQFEDKAVLDRHGPLTRKLLEPLFNGDIGGFATELFTGPGSMAFGMTGGGGLPKLPPKLPAQPWVEEAWNKIDPSATLGRLNQMDNITEGWSGGSASPNYLGELPEEAFKELNKVAPNWGTPEFARALQPLLLRFTKDMGRGDLPYNNHPTQLNSIAPLLAFLMGGEENHPKQGSW